MKKTIIFLLLANVTTFAQVGIGTNAPNDNSILELQSTDKGFLMPRMTGSARTTLGGQLDAADEGLQVYDTTSKSIWLWDGTSWVEQKGGGSTATPNTLYTGSGSLSGNTVVNQGSNTLDFTATTRDAFSIDGTTFSVDAQNNRVGVGTNSPTQALDVNGTARVTGDAQFGSNINAANIPYSTGTGNIPLSITSSGDIVRSTANSNVTSAITFITYRLENVNKDFVSTFNTNIPVSDYVVAIVGFRFDNPINLYNGDVPATNISVKPVFNGSISTWALSADYKDSASDNNGTWEISLLVISKSIANNIGTRTVNLGGSNVGSSPKPSGL